MTDLSAKLIQERITNLSENTDFTATLFESLIGYAVIAADFDGNIIAYNEGARQIYGYTPEEVFGKRNIESFFPGDFIEAGYFQQVVGVLLDTGRFSYEGEKLRKGEQRFPAQILFTLTKDKTGKVVGFVEIVQDLTERKRVEEELRNHRDHLEVLVEKRTAELENANAVLQTEIGERKRVEAELRQRALELAQADRSKDEFLAMLAHELRNPLAPIRTSLHIMRLAESQETVVKQAREVAERQVLHMTRLVDDLLDVSRITRGKVQMRLERLDLTQTVVTTAEDHRNVLQSAGLTLTLNVPRKPVWLVGDPTRLAQMVGNLMHNAIKFTDPGGQITIGLRCEPQGQKAVITILDTGIGIEPDLLPRVFETFIQADRSLDRSRGGLGLGLALVKKLVELHGGGVSAASAGQGKGAEFTIWLPLEGKAALSVDEAGPAGGSAIRPLRILIIEDFMDAAESLRLLLELLGHEVTMAHSGRSGVEAARQGRPDVVLSDIGLPGGMDGYAVAKALRLDPATAHARLIALSGYGTTSDRQRSLEAGFELHLTKPIDPKELQRALALK